MGPNRRPGRGIALVAAIIAMIFSVLLLLGNGYSQRTIVTMDAVLVVCVLVMLAAARWRR